MGERTSISWTDHTWNPWWGCAHVSPGCANCYAETLAARYGHDVWGKQTSRRLFGPKHWAEPLKWNRQGPSRVFCASMADVFEHHPMIELERLRLWDLIHKTPNLTWQILTKRPENFACLGPPEWPLNAWLGVSVEDQRRADERIPLLLEAPAPVRFLSCEPLLGPVDLRPWLYSDELHWVIVGGESGRGYRPMDPDWLHKIVVHCEQAGVACWVKQDSGFRSGILPGRLTKVVQQMP
jgi:protein gp37